MAVATTWAWLAAANVTVVEAYTAPASPRVAPRSARSWPALGPAIVLGLGPMLLGAWKQLQAPLVLGSAALVTLAINAFEPDIARLPRWLPPALIGLLLMWIGATFEKRRDRARNVTHTLMHFG